MRDSMNAVALAALLMSTTPPERASRERRVAEVHPLTGKQPLSNPSSNRKAALLEKARRRAARLAKDTPQ